MKSTTIHLGYAVGTGEPVEIPLAHTFVTGQTQLSGKTTTLRAIVGRSGCRALAFVTKRGERFDGRRVRPYLPREGERPIHWRLVETVMASAMGQRAMKYERLWIVNAAKGARSLAGVRENVARLGAKAKGNSADMYMLLGEYLDLVLPEMADLDAADVLDLRPGLNVMDLGGVGPQLQALVIRASLERINLHERGVLTVFPEAWEFAPRGRSGPAKDEAIAMARKGAVLGNYLLSDSQDIAGVDTVLRQAASVWILGVQRELNELKRTIDTIPAGITRPRAEEVATLGVGQFFACWGRQAVKTYVQPDGMDDELARSIAMGTARVEQFRPAAHGAVRPAEKPARKQVDRVAEIPAGRAHAAHSPPQEDEDTMASKEFQELSGKLDRLTEAMARPGGPAVPASTVTPPPPLVVRDSDPGEEALYQRFKARLLAEVPGMPGGVLHVTPPEKLRRDFQREEVERITAAARDLTPLAKRVLKLIEATDETVSQRTIADRLGRSNSGNAAATLAKAIKDLVDVGFAEAEARQGVRKALRPKVAADLAFYKPTEAELEAVYQAILYQVATAPGAE